MTDMEINSENTPNKRDKIKAHFKKYRTGYLVAGTAAVTAAVSVGVTVLVMKVPGSVDMINKAQNIALVQIKPVSKVTVKVIRRGHPGFVVKATKDGIEQVFPSIRSACEALHIHPSMFYKFMNGDIPDVNGWNFKILGEAAAAS